MKRLHKRIIIVLVIIFTLVLLYHIPKNVNKTICVCSLDGKCLTVSFDVSWYKYFLYPTELHGEFSIDDCRYRTVSQGRSGLSENLRLKFNNRKYIPAFIRVVGNSNYVANDTALLFVSDINLDKLCVNIKEDKNMYSNYYGPAKTAEEARMISESIFVDTIND